MKILKAFKLIPLFGIVAMSNLASGTTWDEPWQEKIIKEADYFVLAKIKSTNHKSVTLSNITTFGGEELKGNIKITNFYDTHVQSWSSGSHGPEFNFKNIKTCYFFIKKNSDGEYCIATPTSGFAMVEDGKVYATYRHSYHQAIVPFDIYEKSMTAIFNHYHQKSYDVKAIRDYIDICLSQNPTGLKEEEMTTFFAQHVALECVYHLRLDGYFEKVLPFLKDTLNFHNQISGARALASNNTLACKQELLKVIADTTASRFVQVICIWTLSEFKPVELKSELTTLLTLVSAKSTGFGGNIMDPRVGTHFPSPRGALEKLIEEL